MTTNNHVTDTPNQSLVKIVVYELKSRGIQHHWSSLEKDQVYELLVSTFASGLSWLSDIEKTHLINYVYAEIRKNDKLHQESILNQEEMDFILNVIRNHDQ